MPRTRQKVVSLRRDIVSEVSEKPDAPHRLSRRKVLAACTGVAGLALLAQTRAGQSVSAASSEPGETSMSQTKESFFRTRGVIISPSDFATWPWPAKAKQAGLTTIATHVPPPQAEAFLRTHLGRTFLEDCQKLGLEVEYEQHALADLLPRTLFEKNPAMFRMNEEGQRTPDANLCVNSGAAVETVCENAVKCAEVLRPTTGRHFFWVDDGRPMCRCPKCRGLSDSDQALLLENRILNALRRTDSRASLAHLCYQNTLKPPTQVKPEPGIFLEFAPITRRYDRPFSALDVPTHAELLGMLDANLAVFGSEGAQALEYWLDVSRFSGWKRADLPQIPWDPGVFREDLATYAKRGIRHITTFACWADGDYVARFGEPPLAEYGGRLQRFPEDI